MRSLIVVVCFLGLSCLCLTSCEDQIDVNVPSTGTDICLNTLLNFDLSLISQEARGVQDTATINFRIRFIYDNGNCVLFPPDEPLSLETKIATGRFVNGIHGIVSCPTPGVTVGFEEEVYFLEPLEMKISPVVKLPVD